MTPSPKRPEIDHRTIKLIVGVIAISLPILVSWLAAPHELKSVSEAYHVPEWPQSIFVGFLYAIAAFLIAYNGRSAREMVCSKVAAAAAFLIAMFPCDCAAGHGEIIRGVHYAAAAVMFCVLAYFCWRFYARAIEKAPMHPRARWRAPIYAVCGAAIVISIAALGVEWILGKSSPDSTFSARWDTFVYWFETVGLVAFGIAWLTASHALPGINGPEERFSPMRSDNPPG
jgi:hypothetical protein